MSALSPHTDFINQDQYLYCWGFYNDSIQELGAEEFLTRVISRTLKSLASVKEHKNKRVRERAFTMWWGSYADMFWVAVPGKLSADPAIVIQNRMRGLAGYYGSDYSNNDVMNLAPFFRYDYGNVIWYADENLAGTEEYAQDDKGRDFLLVKHRCWHPSLMKTEFYKAHPRT